MNTFHAIQHFVSGWRFAVVMISVIFSCVVLMAAILLIPESAGAAATFAEDFKIWCFGYDPATGRMEWAYVWMFLLQPFVLIGFMLMIWLQPLKEVWAQKPVKIVPYVVGAFLIVCTLGATLTPLMDAEPQAVEAASFPADRIRTAHTPPAFTVINQDEEEVSLEALKGRVVLITSVYTRCGYTCPLIMGQTKRAVGALAPGERDGLTVIIITMDPVHDTPEVLRTLTQNHRVEAPFFNAVTGDSANVNNLLDRLGFSRTWDPESGIIDHVNLFVLIDRQGRIAYRFSLSDLQERWLVEALRVLLSEDEQV